MTTPSMHHDVSCEEVVRAVWAYFDDEIDDVSATRIRAHLATCDHYRDIYTFEGAFLRTVSRLLDEPLDTSALRSRILAALHDQGLSEPATLGKRVE